MENLHKEIDAFFDAYAKRFQDVLDGDKVNIEATVNAFAKYFVEASPAGVICSQNNDKLNSG